MGSQTNGIETSQYSLQTNESIIGSSSKLSKIIPTWNVETFELEFITAIYYFAEQLWYIKCMLEVFSYVYDSY
jgi:hypothetical protein